MDSGLEEISDAELLQLALDDRQIDLHTALPARVDSFDASKQTVKITFLLNRYVPDGDDNWVSTKLPQLDNVKVKYPRCKKFMMVFPLEEGDTGLVVFAERNLAAWRSSGAQSDPGDVGMHTLDGAVFCPGLYDDKSGVQSNIGGNMLIGADGADAAQIEITPSELRLGVAAAENVITKKDLQALYFAINAAGVTPNDGGLAFKMALLTGLATAGWTTGTTDGQLGSRTVKAKR